MDWKEQKSSEKAGLLPGDQGLRKGRRTLHSGHGLQAYFCIFPSNGHGPIYKTTPGRWDFNSFVRICKLNE